MKKQTLPLAYPFDWSGLENFDYSLDANGIPQVYMGKKLGLQYNPITISQYGLYHLQKYVPSNDETELKIVQAAAAWLVENFRDWQRDIGAWVYDYDLEFYGAKAPWISGMAQGQGISLLLRTYQLAPDDQILEITQRAFRAFLHPVSEGGVTACFPDGSLIFEEFTTETPSLVLNGYIFALLGILDYAIFWQNSEAQDLFQVAIRGLIKNLHRYDTGYWNLYDLHPTRRLASPMYLKVHVQLLRILANLTGEQVFGETADNWLKYLSTPTCRFRWLTGKVLEKIRLLFGKK
ncbi:hypothetical protein IH799_03345 [candidate division KSB1 bacterium]|nr:hypothetical protein [candidate division KSB1 bacterium]